MIGFPSRRLPHFFCWGKGDEDFFESLKQPIDNFYPIGSLVGEKARRSLKYINERPIFDVCLISQWDDSFMNPDEVDGRQKGVLQLNEHFRRFVLETGIKACVALRTKTDVLQAEHADDAEWVYYRQSHQGRVSFVTRARDDLASYEAASRSRVILAFSSSLAVEAFGWGKKVLYCNLSGESTYAYPHCLGPWLLTACDYETFKDALVRLLQMDQSTYERLNAPIRDYLMAYPKNGVPNYQVLRNAVVGVLRDDRRVNSRERLSLSPSP